MTWYQLASDVHVDEEMELRRIDFGRRLSEWQAPSPPPSPPSTAQIELGPAPSEEDALMSLLEEDELMSLVYSQMLASLEDKRGTSLGWEKLVVEKKAAEKARLLRQSEAEARAKTVAVARARAEVAGAGMLRAAARVRAATEESAVRAEASRVQEARAQEKERLAAEARAKALTKMVAADIARLEAETQRAEEHAAAAKGRATAARAKQAEAEARVKFRVSRSVEAAVAKAAEAEAEARAERLARKFAHEAEAAADEALIRKHTISVQQLWLEQACRSSEGETNDTSDIDSSSCSSHDLTGSEQQPAAVEDASKVPKVPGPIPSRLRLRRGAESLAVGTESETSA